ncbi:GPI-anchored protein LLG2-like [Carica papaya]|uniref:GPI-anchored protein LLG2-like n=1 Tax=Carica papaya TaxID=3649 RepID=UPI000B8CDEC7|nr:GPI-anchored protein LLG2-like [Carica papaya]
MKLVLNFCVFVIFIVLLSGISCSSSSQISYDALESHGTTGRTLLQQKKACPIDFEKENYTIITSQCKGPNYPANICCNAFKEFACPFADSINDMNSDCANTMFSYINLYGRYPPGLFANICKEGQEGLSCEGIGPKTSQTGRTHQVTLSPYSISLMLVATFSLLFFHLL